VRQGTAVLAGLSFGYDSDSCVFTEVTNVNVAWGEITQKYTYIHT